MEIDEAADKMTFATLGLVLPLEDNPACLPAHVPQLHGQCARY